MMLHFKYSNSAVVFFIIGPMPLMAYNFTSMFISKNISGRKLLYPYVGEEADLR